MRENYVFGQRINGKWEKLYAIEVSNENTQKLVTYDEMIKMKKNSKQL